MKPIYYRNNENGECFKVTIKDGIPMSDIDMLLDAMDFKGSEFITEKEFMEAHPKTMDLKVMDKTETYPIATLTCRWMDMSEFEVMQNEN